ncbi:hypothetical protein B0T17DRAFT_510013 [Bombardia bombarda]|uniref:Uncharacterized protein n=1 Tax=Bombardia bombarda TaxID=252184 RepID=A0AA39WN50_9PEZI|nr:hypothetical protein B0T17DRAFT_510013 [Bombardia bombarda]
MIPNATGQPHIPSEQIFDSEKATRAVSRRSREQCHTNSIVDSSPIPTQPLAPLDVSFRVVVVGLLPPLQVGCEMRRASDAVSIDPICLAKERNTEYRSLSAVCCLESRRVWWVTFVLRSTSGSPGYLFRVRIRRNLATKLRSCRPPLPHTGELRRDVKLQRVKEVGHSLCPG